jgi:hypothetical protein
MQHSIERDETAEQTEAEAKGSDPLFSALARVSMLGK